jgi:hypothetical protein
VFHGGWVPLLIGGFVIVTMLTWRRGSKVLAAKTRRLETPIAPLIQSLEKSPPLQVQGTAVFLTSTPESTPTALLHSLKHYKVLHANNVILTIITESIPRVPAQDRVKIEPIGESFMRLVLHFGFMEAPNVPKALAIARKLGWTFDIMSTSFFLSRRSVRPNARSGMPVGRIGCSSSSPRTPTMRRAIFSCRPTAWSRSALRSPCRLLPAQQSPSWPGLSWPSTSSYCQAPKFVMPGTTPGMTNENAGITVASSMQRSTRRWWRRRRATSPNRP